MGQICGPSILREGKREEAKSQDCKYEGKEGTLGELKGVAKV